MRATQDQNVSIAHAVAKHFVHVNVRHLFGYRMFHPAFFHQRHQQRTGFFPRLQAKAFQGALVSMAGDRMPPVAITAARLVLEICDARCTPAQSRRLRVPSPLPGCLHPSAVAGCQSNHQHVDARYCSRNWALAIAYLATVRTDSANGRCAVSPKVKIVCIGQHLAQLAQHGEPAKAGIKYAITGGIIRTPPRVHVPH